MRHRLKLLLPCALVLAVVSTAAAQRTPEPVVRIGDWVEIANEAFMNIIMSQTTRYRTTHNYDFENDIQDRTITTTLSSGLLRDGPVDAFFSEIRLGSDFRYQKNFTARVLFETETVYDGNIIDSRFNGDNSVHIERFWFEYKFPGIPVRTVVGARLFQFDQGSVLFDDDPGIHFYADLGPRQELKLHVAAIIQKESARLAGPVAGSGQVNDNDSVYYLFGATYNLMKGHTLGLHLIYQRDRFTESAGEQNSDNVVIMPSWKGSFGPVRWLTEFLLLAGTADAPAGEDFDIFSWAVMAFIEADLGWIRPSVGLIYARGDDDPTDRDLGGFSSMAQRDVQIVGGNQFLWQQGYGYDPLAPCVGFSPICGGTGGFHTITNPFPDRVGNTAHAGINTVFSNPGIIQIPVGVRIFPVKGHELQLWYWYVAYEDDTIPEALAGGRDINRTLFHNVGLRYIWTISGHFDVHLRANIAIPGEGMKDIAETVLQCGPTRDAPCSGEDPPLEAELQFRARF
jgi:hypothetical protein